MTQPVAIARATPAHALPSEPAVDSWGRLFVALILACWASSFVIGFQVALAILTLSGFIAAVVGVRRPIIGLFGVGMLCTLDPVMNSFLFTGGLWRWSTFNYWLILVSVVFARLIVGSSDARNRLIQLFALLLGLEILVSPDWYRGLADIAAVVTVFGLFVYFVRAGEDPAVWSWLGLVCGTTGAAGGIAFLVQQTSLPPINLNAWGFLPLTALFSICLAFPFARSRRHAQLVLVLLATINYTLAFLSGSRGTLLTATGCGLFLLILMRRMRRGWIVVLAAGLVALAVTTQFTDLQTRAVKRINLLWDPQQRLVDRTSGRSALLIGGWNMFVEHPLGVGTGGYAVTRVSLPGAWRPRATLIAHAGWIKILAENGLPGISLMGAYLVSFVVAGWRSRHRDLLMLGLLVTLVFGLGFTTTEYQSKGLWFLAAGVMALLPSWGLRTRHSRRFT